MWFITWLILTSSNWKPPKWGMENFAKSVNSIILLLSRSKFYTAHGHSYFSSKSEKWKLLFYTALWVVKKRCHHFKTRELYTQQGEKVSDVVFHFFFNEFLNMYQVVVTKFILHCTVIGQETLSSFQDKRNAYTTGWKSFWCSLSFCCFISNKSCSRTK